ncbi:hypothetical protein BGX24_008919, partial [Mortierella sp. AD032]
MRDPETPLATVVLRYSLVRGRPVRVQSPYRGEGEWAMTWCPSIEFKPFQIEILDILEDSEAT